MTRDSAGNGKEKFDIKQITAFFSLSLSSLIFLIILIDQQRVTEVAAITFTFLTHLSRVSFFPLFIPLSRLLSTLSLLADLSVFSGQVGTQLRFLSLTDRSFHGALPSKCAHYNASAGAQVRWQWPEWAPMHVCVQSFVVSWGMRSDNPIAARQRWPNLTLKGKEWPVLTQARMCTQKHAVFRRTHALCVCA